MIIFLATGIPLVFEILSPIKHLRTLFYLKVPLFALDMNMKVYSILTMNSTTVWIKCLSYYSLIPNSSKNSFLVGKQQVNNHHQYVDLLWSFINLFRPQCFIAHWSLFFIVSLLY